MDGTSCGGTQVQFDWSTPQDETTGQLRSAMSACIRNLAIMYLKQEMIQEEQLFRVLEKNTELSLQNTDLQKQVQQLQNVNGANIELTQPVDTLESILKQMREAADKRKELENQHAEALSQLREKQNELQKISKYNVTTPEKTKSNETIEALQSKIRELEKKTELQHVRHEELLLEMATIKRSTTTKVPSSDRSWKNSRGVSANQDVNNSPESGNSTPDSNRVDGGSHLMSFASESTVDQHRSTVRGSAIATSSCSTTNTTTTTTTTNTCATRTNTTNSGCDHAGARHFSLSFPYNDPNLCMHTIPSAAYSRPSLSLWKSSTIADLATSCRANPHFVTASRQFMVQPPNSLPLSIPGMAPCTAADQNHARTAHAHTQASGLKGGSPGATASSTEIDRIMAKIEQDNRILAELDKTRSTIGLSGPVVATPAAPRICPPQPAPEQQVNFVTAVPMMPAQQTVFPQYCSMLPGTAGMLSNYQQPTPRVMPQIPSVASTIPAILATHYDVDARNNLINGNLPAMYSTYTGQEHGHDNKVVDMLDIPGKGRCYVYIARYSYDPFQQSPNENPEAELAINAGDYLLVWGNMDEDGFHDGELLDGRRGLVPSNFIQKLVGEDLLEFHQSVVLGLKDCDDSGITNISHDLDLSGHSQDIFLDESYPKSQAQYKIPGEYNYIDLEDILEEEDESLSEQTGELPVPAPKQLTLERQLNKSVLIGWNHPPEAPPGAIDCYHVYVDGVLKTTVKAAERPRALVEGVDSTRPHRISVRSVTPNRRTSRDAACTMVIGKDVPLGPSNVRANHLTSTSAVISWLPSNSNHQHVVCVNNVEVRTVKPGVYRHTITGLAPNTVYRVTVKAKNIRAPHFDEKSLLPADRLSSHIDFRTLPKGLPDPPVDIQVEAGPQDGTLLVTWLPVMSNMAANGTPVTGYAVYADGKKVTDVDSPTAWSLLGSRSLDLGNTSKLPYLTWISNPEPLASKAGTTTNYAVYVNKLYGDNDNYGECVIKRCIGDHALIDINKLLGLNPKQVTVRTKSRDSQSSDSIPTPVPSAALKGRMSKDVMDGLKTDRRSRERYGSAVPSHMRHHQGGAGHRTTRVDAHGQVIIETEENLSDKEIYPANHINIPSIEITKDTGSEGNYSEDDYIDGRRAVRGHHPSQDVRGLSRSHVERGRPPLLPYEMILNDHPQLMRRDRHKERDQYYMESRSKHLQQMADRGYRGPHSGRGVSHMAHQMGPGSRDKRVRWFVALFDYDPTTMSPNPDACEEELPFSEGDAIKVYGEKDADGFYWGESKGRLGYVPHNMVVEVQELPKNNAETGRGQHPHSRDRCGDIYANMPVKKMIALYDYDPQELSPNVDAEVELSFQTGNIIYVYGEMDDDGFYMGELNSVRGLVPSNFLTEAPPDYGNGPTPRQARSFPQDRGRSGGQSHGPGARGPPPPPRDGRMDPRDRRKDACPSVPSQLEYRADAYHQGQSTSMGRGDLRLERRGGRGGIWTRTLPPDVDHNYQKPMTRRQPDDLPPGNFMLKSSQQQHHPSQQQQQQQHQQQQQQQQQQESQQQQQQQQQQQHTKPLKGVPAVVPDFVIPNKESPSAPVGPKFPDTPNLMQKFSEMAGGADTSVDNIISKGKELIFMKFGLGK